MSVNRAPELHSATISTATPSTCMNASLSTYNSARGEPIGLLERLLLVSTLLLLNVLPDYLRDPAVGRDTFKTHLKTFLFARY